MKPRPEVFLLAAELIDSGDSSFACWALSQAQNLIERDAPPGPWLGFESYANRRDREVALFRSLFDPGTLSGVWWTPKERECRVLALLFCHHIAKDIK